MRRLPRWCLGLGIAVGASQAMCGSSDGPNVFNEATTNGADTGTGGGGGGPLLLDGGGFGDPVDAGQPLQGSLDVQPTTLQTLTVSPGSPSVPSIVFKATVGGQPAAVGWSISRGDIGTVSPGPATTTMFLPTGTTGGLVTVLAGRDGKTVSRQILVKVALQQNGFVQGNGAQAAQVPNTVGKLKAGGGIGGVGGEGLGVAVADAATLTALGAPTGDATAAGLKLLYPYDKTVWPRGMRAPLLMWKWTPGDADAVRIELATTSGSFSWKGTFGRPAILAMTGGSFIRHPIPQDVWDAATNSAGGPTADNVTDKLTLKITVAKGGVGYGPLTETWKVAPARLTGTVYYNSYGTQLVKNWTVLDKGGHSVGAAILGVRSGDVDPKLVVGQNSPTNGQGNPSNNSGCRVCHVVSSRGRWLITQSEQGAPGDGRSFLYDLTAPNAQGTVAQVPQEGVFTWAAMVGDGSFALTNTVDPSSTNPGIVNSAGGTAVSSFWAFGKSPTPAMTSGLPAMVSAGYPSYSPDDKKIAYVNVAGSTQNVKGALTVADYNTTTHAFSNVTELFSPAAGQRLGYPVFVPDNSGVIYETQIRSGQSDQVVVTRNGARSELWWTKLGRAPAPIRLDALNGRGAGAPYIPIGPNNHGIAGATDPQSSYSETGMDDTTLNYEPTVLPIVSGGYAWVVFTSRRLYGNQLTTVPWQSSAPTYDTTDLAQATTKKLWVAAIDLSAPANTDPSLPAFYLPAQEILAGNSRGFWVLDPCRSDGTTCESGDQCCNGYCEPSGAKGALVCSNIPPSSHCSAVQDKCSTASDCCDTTNQCTNGFCAVGVN